MIAEVDVVRSRQIMMEPKGSSDGLDVVRRTWEAFQIVVLWKD